jgi:hypothetical protein
MAAAARQRDGGVGLPLSLGRRNAGTMRHRPQVRGDDDDVGTRQSTGLKGAPDFVQASH